MIKIIVFPMVYGSVFDAIEPCGSKTHDVEEITEEKPSIHRHSSTRLKIQSYIVIKKCIVC